MGADHPKSGVLDQAITALCRGLGERLVAVVLYGSRARGEESPASDWDLLVIAEGLPERSFQRHLFFKRLLPPGCCEAVSILARTSKEFESYLPSLYLDIALDGRILYDPKTYAGARFAKLQALIVESGLYRERRPAGDLWRWRKEPSVAWALGWGK